jgi:hypothetical protein
MGYWLFDRFHLQVGDPGISLELPEFENNNICASFCMSLISSMVSKDFQKFRTQKFAILRKYSKVVDNFKKLKAVIVL